MSEGYGSPDPNQPDQGQPQYGQQQPQYGQQQPYGQPQPYGQQPPAYPPAGGPPAGGGYSQQQQYGTVDAPGRYMNRQLANWLQRVGAYLIDYLIGALPVIVVVILVGTFSSGDSGASVQASGGLVFLAYLATFAIWVYNRAVLQGRTGQSWGKKALNLRLVRMADGQPLGGLMCFVRDIVHVVDALPCLIGYLFPLWDARRQTFGDKIMNTVVLAD
jgi:uncharacterized RDD family membrane protein YckC